MTDKVVVLVTAGSLKEARKIARAVVKARLAACVNVLPRVESHYRWKGVVERAVEYLLTIKTSRARFTELRAAVEKLHSYDVPEIVCLPIIDGSDAYLAWLEESTAPAAGRR